MSNGQAGGGAWINALPMTRGVIVGRRYNRTKKPRGNEPGVNHKGVLVNGQNVLLQTKPLTTAETIGKEVGMDARTVRRVSSPARSAALAPGVELQVAGDSLADQLVELAAGQWRVLGAGGFGGKFHN